MELNVVAQIPNCDNMQMHSVTPHSILLALCIQCTRWWLAGWLLQPERKRTFQASSEYANSHAYEIFGATPLKCAGVSAFTFYSKHASMSASSSCYAIVPLRRFFRLNTLKSKEMTVDMNLRQSLNDDEFWGLQQRRISLCVHAYIFASAGGTVKLNAQYLVQVIVFARINPRNLNSALI